MSNPTKLSEAIAAQGDKNTIPDTTSTSGAASQALGFPPITEVAISAGGKAPSRRDMNGLFNLLSEHTFFQQSGNIYEYDSTLDYAVNAEVLYSGAKYRCIQANGATASNVHLPTDTAYWETLLDTNGRLPWARMPLTQAGAKNMDFDWNGTDLGTISNASQAAQFVGDYGITAGTFGTLKLNQRFTLSTGALDGSSCTYVIAGFDKYLNVGSTNIITAHHINAMPLTQAGAAYMNDTNTTAGGYVGSKMHTTHMATLTTNLQSCLGTHLLHGDRLLSTAVTASLYNRYGSASGASSTWAWTDTYCDLMTENQVYGGIACSSSLYDTGEGKEQMPIFAFVPTTYFGRFYWWLRAVTSSTSFAVVNDYGNAYNHGAAAYSRGVRPLIHIG